VIKHAFGDLILKSGGFFFKLKHPLNPIIKRSVFADDRLL